MRPWLPPDFTPPDRLPVPPGHHLRPIRASDAAIDYPAVMSSRERLWSLFGEPHGWPPESLTYEEDVADLVRHEEEMRDLLSFNYALLDDEERYLAGCVYLDPPERAGADADVSFWVIDRFVGTPLADSLESVVTHWVRDAWPFAEPRVIGCDLTWEEWLRLPPR